MSKRRQIHADGGNILEQDSEKALNLTFQIERQIFLRNKIGAYINFLLLIWQIATGLVAQNNTNLSP